MDNSADHTKILVDSDVLIHFSRGEKLPDMSMMEYNNLLER